MYIYLGLMYTVCTGCFVLLLVPSFDRPKYRPLRGILFVICGLLAGVPLIHAYQYKGTKLLPELDVFWFAFAGALYIFGAFLYVKRIPEKYFPHVFDIFVSFLSHNDCSRGALINSSTS